MNETPDLDLARRWRQRAEEYRSFAAETMTATAKESLRRLSLSYDDMASRAEERAARASASEAAISGQR
jgi:hypothetical protein